MAAIIKTQLAVIAEDSYIEEKTLYEIGLEAPENVLTILGTAIAMSLSND